MAEKLSYSRRPAPRLSSLLTGGLAVCYSIRALRSSMPIRAAFLAPVVVFWSVLAPGAVPHAGAEPHLTDLVGARPEVGAPLPVQNGFQSEPVDSDATPLAQALEQVWPNPLGSFPGAGEPVPAFETVVESIVIGRPVFPRYTVVPVVPVVPVLPAASAAHGAGQYPLVTNSQVGFFLDRFTRERRDVVDAWFGRSGRFMLMVREILKRHGLPEDLAFTAMIESGFNPVATSRAGARGLWQFMATTAKRYGLRVDQWVDERLDPEKSTVAAASYLRDLYNIFGSWFLAQAAYNAGEATITRAIRATGSSDFWTLARTGFVPQETREFVPQIVAATQIGREPHRFGFEPVQPNPPAMDRVAVPGQTDL